jgi:hypothetical protein
MLVLNCLAIDSNYFDMTKQDCKAFIVEHYCELCIFTVARHWVQVREYQQNDVVFRDFQHDKGFACTVVEIGNELFAADG